MTITKLETKAIKIWNKNLIVPHSYNENHRITYETTAILHHNYFMSIDKLLRQTIIIFILPNDDSNNNNLKTVVYKNNIKMWICTNVKSNGK